MASHLPRIGFSLAFHWLHIGIYMGIALALQALEIIYWLRTGFALVSHWIHIGYTDFAGFALASYWNSDGHRIGFSGFAGFGDYLLISYWLRIGITLNSHWLHLLCNASYWLRNGSALALQWLRVGSAMAPQGSYIRWIFGELCTRHDSNPIWRLLLVTSIWWTLLRSNPIESLLLAVTCVRSLAVTLFEGS